MNLTYQSKSNFFKYQTFLEKVSRKLKFGRYFSNFKPLRIALINSDGSGDYIFNGSCFGSGHPIMLKGNKFVITDAYPNERVANQNGFVPIRLISREHAEVLFELYTTPLIPQKGDEWRIDPHPAISRCGLFLTVNFLNGNYRGVAVVDISNKIGDME